MGRSWASMSFLLLLLLPCVSWARFSTFGRVGVFEHAIDQVMEAAAPAPQPHQEQPVGSNDTESSNSTGGWPQQHQQHQSQLVESNDTGSSNNTGGWPKQFPAEVLAAHAEDQEIVRMLHDIMEKIEINNTVIVVPANGGFLDMALNLQCRLRALGSTNHIFWALDEEAAEKLQRLEMPYFHDSSLFSVGGVVGYGTRGEDYVRMMSERPRMWWRLLATGFDILFMDADVVAFDFPENAFERVADFEAQLDYQGYYRWDSTGFESVSNASTICAGVFWIRSSAKSLAWMDLVIRSFQESSVARDEEWQKRGHWDDQIALNFLLHNSSVAAILNSTMDATIQNSTILNSTGIQDGGTHQSFAHGGTMGERLTEYGPEIMTLLFMHPTKLLGGTMLWNAVQLDGPVRGYNAVFVHHEDEAHHVKFRPALLHLNGRWKESKVELLKEHGWWKIDESLNCSQGAGQV